MMAGSLAKNSMLTMTANILLASSNWLLLVIIAKQFNVQTLGYFVMTLSICSPAFLFASFKIRTLLIVDSKWRFTLTEYATARLLSNFFITVCILTLVFTNFIALPFLTVATVIGYKWCDTWSEFCQSYMRRLHKFEMSSGTLAARSLITILFVLLTAVTFKSFNWLLLAWLIVAMIFALFDTYLLRRLSQSHEKAGFSFSSLMKIKSVNRAFSLYREYITVAVAVAISSLFVHLPNILLGYQLDIISAGIFATISYFLIAGGIFVNSVSQASTPRLAHLLKTGDYEAFILLIKKLCLIGIIIGASGLVISVFSGKYFLTLFYTPDIAKFSETLNWVMAAAAVRYVYIFLGTSLAAAQQFHIQTKIYALGLLTMLCGGYLLIDANGLVGAGQAMFAATIVELMLFVLVTKNSLQLAFSKEHTGE
jgi:O-antigen/teichoic acid export membrane protein